MKLAINEIFYSIQGEGLHMGTPSVFVRLAGCNLACSWCDTAYAISNSDCITLTPHETLVYLGKGSHYTKLVNGAHLIFTGGEPMLQQKEIYALYLEFLNMVDQNKEPMVPYIEVETNGTIPVTVGNIASAITHATISPKLANSGEPEKRRYRPKVLQEYIDHWYKPSWKFVVNGEEDMKEIVRKFAIEFGLQNEDIWLMPAGRTRKEIVGRAKAVVELCKEYGFKYSPRLHIDLWNGEKGK